MGNSRTTRLGQWPQQDHHSDGRIDLANIYFICYEERGSEGVGEARERQHERGE